MARNTTQVHFYLYQEQIDKLKEELIRQNKNPEAKRSEFIRRLINSFNSDKVYYTDKQFEDFQKMFEDINRLGSNLNQLMYYLNVEHIEFIQNKTKDFSLNEGQFSELLKDLYEEVLIMKNELRAIAKSKRID